MKRLLREMILDYCAIDSLGVKIGLLLIEASTICMGFLSIYDGIMQMEYSVLQSVCVLVYAVLFFVAAWLAWMAFTYRTHMSREL